MSLLEGGSSGDLWVTAKKSDGTEMPYIKETADMDRWKKEEPQIFEIVYKALNAWIAQSPEANKKALQTFKEGFTMIHDGMKYKVLQFKDGTIKVSKWKAGSGGAKPGQPGYKSNYVHMRVEQIKMVRLEDAFDTINNQEDNDNWTFPAIFDRTDEKGGPIFVMVNSRPYTPKQESTSAPAQQSNPLLSESTNEESNEESHQE